MKKKDKIKVGISVGDLNGIGIEIVLKSFEDSRMLDFCTPVIFASSKVVSYHKKALELTTNIHGIDAFSKIVPQKLNLLNVWKEMVDVELGKPTEVSGKYALISLDKATEALKKGDIDVLVTAPIDKNNIQSETFKFKGHTEFLESKLEGEALMILCSGDLRVGLITGHVPIQKVAEEISADLISKKVAIMYKSLVEDFNISKPKIAVLGLNPHCGDQGVIGTEDDEIVRPTHWRPFRKKDNWYMVLMLLTAFLEIVTIRNLMAFWRCITIRDWHHLKHWLLEKGLILQQDWIK